MRSLFARDSKHRPLAHFLQRGIFRLGHGTTSYRLDIATNLSYFISP
jgi:hypothetical protein